MTTTNHYQGHSSPTFFPIGGHMRFNAHDLEEILTLLHSHPVVVNGGTVEVCELPKT